MLIGLPRADADCRVHLRSSDGVIWIQFEGVVHQVFHIVCNRIQDEPYSLG